SGCGAASRRAAAPAHGRARRALDRLGPRSRTAPPSAPAAASAPRHDEDLNPAFEPMLASLADAPLDDPHLVYEPKYDGIRAIVEIGGRGSSNDKDHDPRPPIPPIARLWSRLGNEKTNQFPEITAALERWARARSAPLVL